MKPVRIPLRCLLVFAIACGIAGCARVQFSKLRQMARTELYFGLSMPGGKTVSEAEWKQFVDEHITPRFRKGLTVLDASGQWRGQSGKIISERTKVVILVHRSTPDSEIALFNIISAYKRRFRQDAVMRVTDRVGVSF